MAPVHVPFLAENFAPIHAIRSQRSGVGFDRIHVRQRPRTPLDGLHLLRADLAAVLAPDWHGPVGIAFRSELRRVVSGTQDAGVAALMRLADRFGAFVVEWSGVQSYPAITGR